ncbi:hypothetical protein Y1Q_0012463 [Alligator mississippiensis]|uniref:Uncharacterized protein n=1 Tax=Alligator mississippiensis TaxID=8496 RepID=A0A151M7Y4_ALLMI|nr:hypothetical protein Y1Q_0012463 [Alligator mississippiensis]
MNGFVGRWLPPSGIEVKEPMQLPLKIVIGSNSNPLRASSEKAGVELLNQTIAHHSKHCDVIMNILIQANLVSCTKCCLSTKQL